MDVWYKQLKNHASPDCKIFLIGNKSDLEENRQITYDEGLNCCHKYKFQQFYETSAKTGINVTKLFTEAAKLIYKEQRELRLKETGENNVQSLYKLNKNLDNLGDEDNENGCC